MENMFINLNKTLRGATLKIFIAALAFTLVFSESAIKSIINDWMSECKVIVQIEKPERMNNSKYKVPLQLYVIGSSSVPLHLKLKTRNSSTIERISFVGKIDKNQKNLLLHPLAGLYCGTETYSIFCSKSKSNNTFDVHIIELSSNHIYSIAVYISSDKTELKSEDLIVYSHPSPSDEINNKLRCKLEGSTWLNYYARQGTTFRLISLGVFLFVITLMLAAARKILKNEP